jgi:hypothetical protein
MTYCGLSRMRRSLVRSLALGAYFTPLHLTRQARPLILNPKQVAISLYGGISIYAVFPTWMVYLQRRAFSRSFS